MNRLVGIGIATVIALIAATCVASAASVTEFSYANLSEAWMAVSARSLLRVKLQCDLKNGRVVCGEKKGGKKASHDDNDDHHHKKKHKDENTESTQSDPAKGDETSKDAGATTTTPNTKNACGGDNVLWGDYCYTNQKQ